MLDYSQFYLHSPRPEFTGHQPPDDPVEILHRAFASGIAQGAYTTVVVTPHHDNYDMVVLLELWNTEPDNDLADWEEAFEASITAGTDGIVFESPTMLGEVMGIPPGSYRIRICGRDFFRQPWTENDNNEYADNYRFQLWPETLPTEPRAIKKWDHPADCGHV